MLGSKKYKISFSLLIILATHATTAQNLVINPSFEVYQICPDSAGFGGISSRGFNWWKVQGWWGLDTSITNYYNACANVINGGVLTTFNGVPFNSYGYRYAKSGNAYCGLYLLSHAITNDDAKAYLQGNFTQALIKDSIYCVSYWVSLCGYNKRAIKNIDAYINDTLLNWNNGWPKTLKGFVPQIQCNRFITDTLNWQQVQGLYKAKGGEQYITIGNFNTDATTATYSLVPNNGSAVDYYLDDVSVSPFRLQAPNLGPDKLLCPSQLPLTLSAPLGYDSLKWSNGATTLTTTLTQPGKYWLRCTSNGCGSLTDTIIISTYNLPKLKLSPDTALCKGATLTLKTNTIFLSYNWSTGATTTSITINKAGNYILTVTDACGTQKDTVTVMYDSLPNFKLNIGNNVNICKDDYNVPYTIKPNNPILPNYTWNTGETTPHITTNQAGHYWFTTKFKCGTLQSNTISIATCPPDTSLSIWLPNTFTPNEDGLNETWHPVVINQNISLLNIYNSWGQKVFTGTPTNNYTWDGTFNNLPCQQGVYAYIIIYKAIPPATLKTREYQKTGLINLIR